MTNFQKYIETPDHVNEDELPHQMFGERFLKKNTLGDVSLDMSGRSQAPESIVRVEGLFCNSCESHANDCYWKCEICNEGGWGYCNTCVNTGRHCTHPLIAHRWDETLYCPLLQDANSSLGSITLSQAQSVMPDSQTTKAHLCAIDTQTACNVCGKVVQTAEPYLHCSTCNRADYDICMACYDRLSTSRSLEAASDGLDGWRKCEQGHRMTTVVFEKITAPQIYSADGSGELQQRFILEGPVGGFRGEEQNVNRDDSAVFSGQDARRQPGRTRRQTRFQALWTRIPDEGVTDELMFPRGAVITEVEEMNQDWSWGVYCGRAGLFPGAFGRLI